MANGQGGQQKMHWVTHQVTGERKQVTQAQWKIRHNDPTMRGFVRDDVPSTEDGPNVDDE
jgi:hypothetical protein